MVKIKAGDVVLDDANKCWIVTAISRMPHTHPHGLVHLVIPGRPHGRRNVSLHRVFKASPWTPNWRVYGTV